jgi:hypothetical protein
MKLNPEVKILLCVSSLLREVRIGALEKEQLSTRNARLNSWKFVLVESELTADGLSVCGM